MPSMSLRLALDLSLSWMSSDRTPTRRDAGVRFDAEVFSVWLPEWSRPLPHRVGHTGSEKGGCRAGWSTSVHCRSCRQVLSERAERP